MDVNKGYWVWRKKIKFEHWWNSDHKLLKLIRNLKLEVIYLWQFRYTENTLYLKIFLNNLWHLFLNKTRCISILINNKESSFPYVMCRLTLCSESSLTSQNRSSSVQNWGWMWIVWPKFNIVINSEIS